MRDDGTPQRLMQVRNPWGYREPCLTAELTLSGNTMVSRTPTLLDMHICSSFDPSPCFVDKNCSFILARYRGIPRHKNPRYHQMKSFNFFCFQPFSARAPRSGKGRFFRIVEAKSAASREVEAKDGWRHH